MSILSAPRFHDETVAIAYLESIVWANGVSCPHCGSLGKMYALNGKGDRPGLRKCSDCNKKFTVKVGTVFESSHVKLHLWLQAAYLMASSKKGISSHQLHRTLGVTYKTAWFMTHRLREAMRVLNIEPMGGEGKTVEADETYFGGLEKNKHKNKHIPHSQGGANKEIVFSLVERGGKVRSQHVTHVTAENLRPILMEQLHTDSILMTDEARQYKPLGKAFAEHHSVNHGIGEYVRGDAHTNTIEGYFSVFKRGMKGIYQHCNSRHLKRYLAEFDFRYNERHLTDSERSREMLIGILGKRLVYKTHNC